MSEFDPITFFSLVFLGLTFVFVGWFYRVEQQSGDSRKYVPISQLWPALLVVVGSGELALAVSMILVFGFAGTSFLFGLGGAMLVMLLMTDRYWSVVDKNPDTLLFRGFRNFTTPDYIRAKFGFRNGMIATAITAFAFWGILLLQFLLGGTIISAATGASQAWSVALLAIVVAAYSSLGGFAALYKTDFYQNALMWLTFIATVAVLYFLHWDIPSFSASLSSLDWFNLGNWSNPTIVSLFLVTLIAAFGGPDLWQRVNMAESKGNAKKGLLCAAIGVFFLAILATFLTVDIKSALSTVASISSGNELLQYLSIVTSGTGNFTLATTWPDSLRIVFAVGLLSAIISTADTSVMLVATSIQNEQLHQRGVKIETKEANSMLTGMLIVVASIAAALVSLTAPEMADTFIAVLGVLGVLGLPVFLSLFGFGGPRSCLFALCGGIAIILLQTFASQQLHDINPLLVAEGYGLLLPFLPSFVLLGARTTNSEES